MYIDNYKFAISRETLELEVEVRDLERAKDLLDGLAGTLLVKLKGDVSDKPLLNVSICGKISTLCQICLDHVEVIIEHNGNVPIFKNEALLDEALFGENADCTDGILSDPQFNVSDFIEDEIIMLLPLAPKHDTCHYVSVAEEGNNPFGMLKQKIN